jgi:hypothetical protein
MKIEIERTDNGFIFKHTSGDPDQDGVMVYEERESHEDDFIDLDTLQSLLFAVCESFGYYGSKHDRRRLFVKIVNQFDKNGKEVIDEPDTGDNIQGD